MVVIDTQLEAGSNPVIVALDSTSPTQLLPLVDDLVSIGFEWFKVGLATWLSGGPQFVEMLLRRRARVFLDLKLHDIPHQVHLAAKAVAGMGVELLTIHAEGGADMVDAAVTGAGDGTRVIAVTVLTSLPSTVDDVISRGRLALNAGAAGIVCSAQEAAPVRATLGDDVLLVTPGIRPEWAQTNDQKRIASPRSALESGSSLLVIGRPITASDNPLVSAQRILDEIHA